MMQRLPAEFRQAVISCLILFVWNQTTVASADEFSAMANQHTWVWSLDLESEESQRLFPIVNAAAVHELAVSSDGRTFAYSGRPVGNVRNQRIRIWTCDAAGENVRDLGCGRMPSWSPQGKRLVFSRIESEAGVWIMRADGRDQKILDAQGSAASWSADGRQIAWLRPIAGKLSVVLYDVAEDDFDVVTTDVEFPPAPFSGQLKWSPQNTKLCLVAGNNKERAWLMTLNASQPANLRRLDEQRRSFSEPPVWLSGVTVLHEGQCYSMNDTASGLSPQSNQKGQLVREAGVFADMSRDARVVYYLKQSSE